MIVRCCVAMGEDGTASADPLAAVTCRSPPRHHPVRSARGYLCCGDPSGGRRHPRPRRLQGRAGQEPAPGRRGLAGRPGRPAARAAGSIDEVYVSHRRRRGSRPRRGRPAASVIDRPAELAGDTRDLGVGPAACARGARRAPTDRSTSLVFLQCTSPFIAPSDLDAAVALVLDGRRRTRCFSAVDNHAFLWRPDGDRVVGVNHDASRRQRRQDRDPEYRETGGFYVFRADRFAEVGTASSTGRRSSWCRS